MSETTAHLIDNVLPHVPYRQYVTTFPHSLRFWLATSRHLTNVVHKIVTKMIMLYYVSKAEDRGIKDPVPGGTTFVQRFGSALNLNIHLHSVVIEGVYSVTTGTPVFYPLPGPSDEEVADIVEAIAHSVITALKKKGYLSEEGEEVERPQSVDKIFAESEQLTAAAAASSSMRVAFGERAGHVVRKIGKGFGYDQEIALAQGKRCYSVNGFTVHANRYIGEQERQKLEELISYCARGPFSDKRSALRGLATRQGEETTGLTRGKRAPWRVASPRRTENI